MSDLKPGPEPRKILLKERLEILTRQAWEHGVKQAHQSIFDDERMNEDETVEFMDLNDITSEYDKSIIASCDPLHNKKSTKKSSGSGKSSNNPDLANLPYDPNLCSKRMWNDGLGCQCQKAAVEDGQCGRHKKMFDTHGVHSHGFYNEERPLFDLKKPKQKHAWKDLKGSKDEKKPKMLVDDIREKLEEFGLDTTGKKPEILQRLNDYMDANQDEEVAEPSPKKMKKAKKAKKAKKEKKAKKKGKVSLTPKKPVMEKMVMANGQELNLHLGDEGPVENPLNVLAENSPVPAENSPVPAENSPVPAENSPVPAEKSPVPAEKVNVPIEEDSGDETGELSSSEEEEFDEDDFNEVEFEGVDYLLNQETMELISMAGQKIGGWNSDDSKIIWNETVEGLKAKEFHYSQQ